MSETLHLVDMENGGRIALYRLRSENAAGLPVIIAHGTISNADTVRTLGRFLATRGFDCWLLEWAGHGQSEPASSKQNFEYPAFNDLPAAIHAVLRETQQQRVIWLAHSGGGHLPLMYLSRHPEKQTHFAGIVAIGTQSTHAATRLRDKFAGVVLWCITMLMNRTPKVILPVGNEHEPTRLLLQWANWNMKQRWLGEDGLDYMAALAGVTVPAIVVAGGNDSIAPAAGCRAIFEAIGSSDKTWILCSEAHGFSRDLAHGQLIRGPIAQNEVFPRLEEWLRCRIGQD
ncbi:MAG: alpha/beta fold hydrolase [Planctomycetaceae bacterium]|jgi:oxygen-independent coproporphyrinogen-3 oxidase